MRNLSLEENWLGILKDYKYTEICIFVITFITRQRCSFESYFICFAFVLRILLKYSIDPKKCISIQIKHPFVIWSPLILNTKLKNKAWLVLPVFLLFATSFLICKKRVYCNLHCYDSQTVFVTINQMIWYTQVLSSVYVNHHK